MCVIGTTSTKVPYEECDHLQVTPDEVNLLLSEGAKLSPVLAQTRILRAYAGVRPLVSADNDPTGRNISRGIVCLDHETRDGIKGLVTITGGKLMTYRLMAEQATDMACKKLGLDVPCATATTPLPGSEEGGIEKIFKNMWTMPTTAQKATVGRAGANVSSIPLSDEYEGSVVCECEEVPVSEIDSAIKNMDVHNLVDLRRRTRMGMGTCQGELCGCRAACILAKDHGDVVAVRNDLKQFMNERWKGMYPVAWGETLRECAYTQWVYSEVLGLNES